MTRIAQTAPAYCASCYTVRPGEEYVDFEAAYNGPVLIGDQDHNGNWPKQPIDDLVICKSCLREAATLLNLGEDKEEIDRQNAVIEAAIDDIEAKDRMIHRLEMTLAELVDHPVAKVQGGASQYAGLPEEIKNRLERRRQDRNLKSRKAREAQRRSQQNQEKVNANAD